ASLSAAELHPAFSFCSSALHQGFGSLLRTAEGWRVATVGFAVDMDRAHGAPAEPAAAARDWGADVPPPAVNFDQRAPVHSCAPIAALVAHRSGARISAADRGAGVPAPVVNFDERAPVLSCVLFAVLLSLFLL